MNIAFYTLGCKVNQYESQAIGECLVKAGHTVVNDTAVADCVIINSCTVTAESDRKTRQAVRRFRRTLPNAIIILAGCMPQAFPEKTSELDAADIITGNSSPEKIPHLIDRFLKTGEQIIEIEAHGRCEKFTTPPVSDFQDRTRAFMKVEDGCDRWCTYCVIPHARGVVRSRPVDEIITEAQCLAKNGFSEIVLVGINLTSYGKECGLNICDAVSAAASPEGIKRVRLGSLEPDHISDDVLCRLASEPKFCPQFHLALQSGCDATLKRMNRHYDTEFYSDLVERIRRKFENASITTDIMVGFAGETEADFNESVEFLRKMRFARTHVFAYSRREGTVAAALPEQVPSAEKERRAAVMSTVASEMEAVFLKTQVGRRVSVLFETYKNGIAEGYSENYTRVRMQSEQDISGKTEDVIIVSSEADFCIAEMV